MEAEGELFEVETVRPARAISGRTRPDSIRSTNVNNDDRSQWKFVQHRSDRPYPRINRVVECNDPFLAPQAWWSVLAPQVRQSRSNIFSDVVSLPDRALPFT